MQIIHRQLPPDHKIYFVSDTHEGSAMKHKSGLYGVIGKIASEKQSYMIHGGDVVEGIAIDDKRYDPATLDPNTAVPLLQYQAVSDELSPVKDKLLGIHQGNHDAPMLKHGDFVRDLICKDLGVPYATYSAKYLIKGDDGKVKYRIFYTHGARSLSSNAKDPIQTLANMQATIKKRLYPLASDAMILGFGHTHKLIVVPPTEELALFDNGSKIEQSYVRNVESTRYIDPSHRWYLNSGSFMKLYGDMGTSGYAEKAMYAPTEIGYCVAHIANYKVMDVEKVVV